MAGRAGQQGCPKSDADPYRHSEHSEGARWGELHLVDATALPDRASCSQFLGSRRVIQGGLGSGIPAELFEERRCLGLPSAEGREGHHVHRGAVDELPHVNLAVSEAIAAHPD